MFELEKPNIVIMYADDLGFGDVGCYGATDIPTPNIDRLAAEGIRFTSGYSTASTCTPARYSLLTGSYPWRNSRAAILPGDASQIIPTGSPTMPTMFQNKGYATGIVGKWHLGLGSGSINWNDTIVGTPNDVGFDYSYIMAATNDRVPCVYVDNRHVENLDPEDPIEVTYDEDEAFSDLPSGKKNPELLKMMYSHGHDCTIINGISRMGYMSGGKNALWDDETMCDVFLDKAIDFIEDHQKEPFFLYYAFHEPHVPRVPSPRFVGSTDLGPRGDVIVEMDWCVGQLLDKLEELGIKENTMVVFSSDNGPVLNDGYLDQAEELKGNHKPAGPLRGGKYSLFEGGTRVPFLLSWPKKVKPGTSDAVVCHVDFHASFAKIIGHELGKDEAPDSQDVLDALIGSDSVGRKELVTEGKGKTLVRMENWIYIPPYEGRSWAAEKRLETGISLEPQLYNIDDDISQIKNKAKEETDRVKLMAEHLRKVHEVQQTR